MDEHDQAALICHRCGRDLHPGRGDWYVVRIEAFADPTPPVMDREVSLGDLREQLRDVLHELEEMTEQELMDQVFRRLTLHLCGTCYRQWIEEPV